MKEKELTTKYFGISYFFHNFAKNIGNAATNQCETDTSKMGG